MQTTVSFIEGRYPSPLGHNSAAYWVPIAMLEEVQEAYRAAGISVKCRFRGPREQSIGRVMPNGYTRIHRQAMQDCLKADATHFSVYYR